MGVSSENVFHVRLDPAMAAPLQIGERPVALPFVHQLFGVDPGSRFRPAVEVLALLCLAMRSWAALSKSEAKLHCDQCGKGEAQLCRENATQTY